MNLNEEYLNGNTESAISMEESGERFIYKKYIEFRVPISAIGLFPEISESLQMINNPITSESELKFLSGISELQSIIKKVDENFDDIVNRQVFFVEFKEKLNDLWKIGNGREREAVILMKNAIKDLKSEKLTKEKLKSLEKAIKIMRIKTDREGLREIDKILLDARIFTIPVIDELSEMYENE